MIIRLVAMYLCLFGVVVEPSSTIEQARARQICSMPESEQFRRAASPGSLNKSSSLQFYVSSNCGD